MVALDHSSEMLEKASASERNFRQGIRAAVRGLWYGHLPLFGFIQSMNATITWGFRMAFQDGARQVGILPGDLTETEKGQLEMVITNEQAYISGFGQAILDHKRKGGKIGNMFKRADMWANRYSGIRSWAMSLVGADKKLVWIVDITKEHCRTCLRLQGRVYRASIWQKYGVYPRHRALECKGYRCGCSFRPTTDPVTPGRPPSIP